MKNFSTGENRRVHLPYHLIDAIIEMEFPNKMGFRNTKELLKQTAESNI